MKSSRLTKILASIAVAGTIAFLLSGLSNSGTTKEEPQRITKVTKGTLLQRVTVAGSVVSNRKTIFTPPFNAYVKKIFVRIGQQVRKGTPIVSFTQSLREIEEEIYPMRAPYAGTVVQIPRFEGEYVETGKENNIVVRVDDLSRLFIHAKVAEGEVRRLESGQEVIVKSNAILEKQFKGIIREIALASVEKKDWSPSGNRVEYDVRMEVLGDKDGLLPGMSATVDIITGKKEEVLLLAVEYVEKREEKYWVTKEDGERVEVTIGLQNEENFEIISGLKGEERIRQVDFFSIPEKKS